MTAADFKDHFSTSSDAYQRYRPGYPAELFAWLAQRAPGNTLAWDCATGTGQAARALAEHFSKVIASDASAQQISQAQTMDNIEYVVARAESMVLDDNSIDLISVAQALHWFEQAVFYRIAWRCLKPGGILAIWHYNLVSVEPVVDEVIHWYYHQILGPYWPAERALVEQGYPPMPAPFTAIASPEFNMQRNWSMHELLGYLSTWSAGKNYEQTTQHDPLKLLQPRLSAAWGEPEQTRLVRWPLRLQTGIKHDMV